jgi:ABC-2 type transport system ATP-binding protein
MTAIIQTERLTKAYGEHRGIIDVDLLVNAGEVFGFLGPNGAGKTTTIRTVLDLIRPTSGRALVFGIESTVDPVAIHRRIGYIPGEFTLYDRLTGGQTIEYFANLRGGVDKAYQRSLIERFDIDPKRRYKELSKGNKQKIGLVIALQHRPELLILDEPTSGLDPLVQQSFFELVREARAEGRTVFLSSHILSEVERTADRVAIIREGRLVKVDSVEGLRDLAHHQVELRFSGAVPVAAFEALPGVSEVSAEEHVLRMRVSGPITPVVRAAAQYELLDFVSREPTLEETFLAQYGPGAGNGSDRASGNGANGTDGGSAATPGQEPATPAGTAA